jgi:hypothetical protein
MNAKTSLKCKSGEIITGHINPEIVFRRALVLANSRDDVTIDNILCNERTGETSFSNCFTRFDLQEFLVVPSSWNMDTGIGPTGCERMLSIVTSSLLLAKTTSEIAWH